VVSALRISLPVVIALACAAACSRSGEGAAGVASQQSTPSATTVIESHLPLVERIQMAPLRVPHAGTRRLSFYFETPGPLPSTTVENVLAYTERVTADGHGNFALDPVSVDTPAMSAAQHQVFDLVQKQREGFFFRYRDFGVRERALFLANYQLHVMGQTSSVAGRACTEIEVRRRRSAPTWYRIAVDETGLVLRWSEYSAADDRLRARSEFLDLTLEPVLDGIEWFDSDLDVQALVPGQEDTTALGFRPHQPQVLPLGYQLLRSELVENGGVKWLRRVYGDGVESFFVLERGPAPAPGTTAPGGAQGTTSTARSDWWGDHPPPVVVRVCQVGSWTLAEAAQGVEQLFVVGKVGEEEVLTCLRSAY
jgi:hypothetical protein